MSHKIDWTLNYSNCHCIKNLIEHLQDNFGIIFFYIYAKIITIWGRKPRKTIIEGYDLTLSLCIINPDGGGSSQGTVIVYIVFNGNCCRVSIDTRLGMSIWNVPLLSESDRRHWRRRPQLTAPLPVRLQPQFVPLFVTGLPVRDNTPNLLPPLFFATPDTQTFIYSHFYSGQEILGGGEVPLNLVFVTSQVSVQVRHLNREETEQGCCLWQWIFIPDNFYSVNSEIT